MHGTQQNVLHRKIIFVDNTDMIITEYILAFYEALKWPPIFTTRFPFFKYCFHFLYPLVLGVSSVFISASLLTCLYPRISLSHSIRWS